MKFDENRRNSVNISEISGWSLGVVRRARLVPRRRSSRPLPFSQPPYQPLAGLIGISIYYSILLYITIYYYILLYITIY